MIRGAIFDMDGLMFETERLFAISWAEQARRFGFQPVPEFHRAVCGTSGTLARDIVRKFYPGIPDANSFINDGCDRVADMMAESVPEKEGLHEIVDYLKGLGLRLAVASSSEAELIRANLTKTGLAGQFDVLLSTSQVARGKPVPDVFLEAARRLGLAPGECYVFEDGINGVKAGIAAGCHTYMIPDMIPPTQEIREQCDGVFPSLLVLLEFLKGSSDSFLMPIHA